MLRNTNNDYFSLATFQENIPPMSLINCLNPNAIISLENNLITKGKIEINIHQNSHTIFLTATVDILFSISFPQPLYLMVTKIIWIYTKPSCL